MLFLYPKNTLKKYNNKHQKNTISPQKPKYTIQIPAPYPHPTLKTPTKIQ